MKLIALVLMLVISTSLFSQQSVFTKEEYLKKSKSQKTAAWVLAGGGGTLFIAGIVAYSIKVDNTDNPWAVLDTSELFWSVLGGSALIVSKFLFKSSAKNKRKAASLSLKREKIQSILYGGPYSKHIPAIGLTIRVM